VVGLEVIAIITGTVSILCMMPMVQTTDGRFGCLAPGAPEFASKEIPILIVYRILHTEESVHQCRRLPPTRVVGSAVLLGPTLELKAVFIGFLLFALTIRYV
jgi:hypothetical protein